jgi:Cysteine rich repeat
MHACRNLFEDMMEARSLDFRLDPTLSRHCEHDIKTRCKYDLDRKQSIYVPDAGVLMCLQNSRDVLEPACHTAVAKTIERGSEDMRFAIGLSQDCKQDREKLCSQVPKVLHTSYMAVNSAFRPAKHSWAAAC